MAGELDALRIREEVLQAMYWLRSEGLDDEPSASTLARFLVVPVDTLAIYLDRFAAEGYLEGTPAGYRLTPEGETAGKRTFAEEFADLTRPAHGECDDDCWCHESPEEAKRCLEERLSAAR